MIYFITGGTGFVGSHMIDYLLREEQDSIIYVLRRWRSDSKNVSHLLNNERVIFIEGDLLDFTSLKNAIQISRPDYVYHFASQSYPMYSFKSPITTLETNIIGTTNLLECLREARDRGICNPLIVSVSSSEVYGNPKENEVPIKETNPLRAANPYSISKVGHDLISQYYYNAYKMRIVITRMFSHEGMRRGNVFALSNFAYQIVKNEREYLDDIENVSFFNKKYTIYVGNLNSIRTYAHIEDAIRAYYLCLKCKEGEVYNIGGDNTCTVGEALENMLSKSIIPRDMIEIVVSEDRIRPTDITLQIPDCSKFKKETGWKPIKTLDDITSDLLIYWRNNI